MKSLRGSVPLPHNGLISLKSILAIYPVASSTAATTIAILGLHSSSAYTANHMVDYAQYGTSFYGFNSRTLSLNNMLIKLRSSAERLGLEGVIWVAALLFLAFQDPYSTTHLSLFWPSWVFDIQSPGYNLGHSISFLFRANISDSVQAHYLGIPTAAVLIARVITLLRQQAVSKERLFHG